MALILAASLLPPAAGARGGVGWHLAGYTVLGALLSRVRPPGAAWTIGAWAIGTAYGALIEGLQWVVGYRTAELLDAAVNAAGVAIGLAAALLAERAWGRGRHAPPA